MKKTKIALITLGILTAAFIGAGVVTKMKDKEIAQQSLSYFDSLDKNSLDYKAMSILVNSGCAYCHTQDERFHTKGYDSMDAGMINSIAEEAIQHFNMTLLLDSVINGNLVPAKKLEEIQEVLDDGSMPPAAFLMLHWASALSDDEKQTLYSWISEKQAQNSKQLGSNGESVMTE